VSEQLLVDEIINENKRRNDSLYEPYDPILGIGSPIKRIRLNYLNGNNKVGLLVPESFYNTKVISELSKIGSIDGFLKKYYGSVNDALRNKFNKELIKERMRHDFEFYSNTCLTITDKETSQSIKLRLRKVQRKFLKELEDMRLKNIPIRANLLKSRQWGGSTLTEAYMFWIQTLIKTGWSSAIIADVEDQARNIRGMYETFVEYHPLDLGKLSLSPYRGSSKNKIINERNCIVGIGSFQKPENLRSFSFKMLHETELASWIDTRRRKGKNMDLALTNTIPDQPYTFIVKESTAKGIGNHWHNTWLASETGKGGYKNIFIPFFEVEIYQKPINNIPEFISTMTAHDKYLWELGATLESINWHNWKKNFENFDDWNMCEEFPATAEEAFQSTGQRAFAPIYVSKNKVNVCDPEFIGDIFASESKGKKAFEKIEFHETPDGNFQIWAMPDLSVKMKDRYVVIVDIGGRTSGADYSVIKVLDRYWMAEGGKPEVVAVWRGHLDQDLLAWKAAQIAKFYNNGHLVVEVNSLRTEEDTEADHSLTVLDEIVEFYPNMYIRNDPEKVKQGEAVRYGFHTNKKTKPMVIDHYNGILRDEAYIERSKNALNEADQYEKKPNGSYGAKEGCHDDELMTTAIGCYVAMEKLDPPKIIKDVPKNNTRRFATSEAVI